jgi:hypothetical protein
VIVYHGTPITPQDAAARILAGRHGLVSFATPIEEDRHTRRSPTRRPLAGRITRRERTL